MIKKISISILGLVVVSLIGCGDLPYDNGLDYAAVTPYTQDLIGARGRDAEYSMQERGFVWIRTEKSNYDTYSYWRHDQSGQCLTVRTGDGRYESITNSPDYVTVKGETEGTG